jgi:phage terminase small subunit
MRTIEDVPILKNHKHELFAQSLAKGETARKAYCDAGYEDNRKNAWRLKTNKDVAARVLEIQQASAASAEINAPSRTA